MDVATKLSCLALRQVVGGVCRSLGLHAGAEAADTVARALAERYTDHSQRLPAALASACEKAWTAMELALAGDTIWERVRLATARAEDKALSHELRLFVDAATLPNFSDTTPTRQECLAELRAARIAKFLLAHSANGQASTAGKLAESTANFARFDDAAKLWDEELRVVARIADDIERAGYSRLAWLLRQQPVEGRPLLVVAVRYFFRRALENDPQLFQGVALDKLASIEDAQERGFVGLSEALAQQGERLRGLLDEVRVESIRTHSAVLELGGQLDRQTDQIREIGEGVAALLLRHQLQRRELRAADSLSIRNDSERRLVKELVARYRGLPQDNRDRIPALLHALGKLQVVSGDFDSAQKDFQQVAELVVDPADKAEAHYNAHRAALERRDWETALVEYVRAVDLDPKRFELFPLNKYKPLRILGAGGFGVAFLCQHAFLGEQVVVKTLSMEGLDTAADEVFNEVQLLRQLHDPSIIRAGDCGYMDTSAKARPFLMMDYYDAPTLEQHVKLDGPLSAAQLVDVMQRVASGLQAAHTKGVLHRDIKPSNLLLKKAGNGWEVKLIDFGLAVSQQVVSESASHGSQLQSLAGQTVAGTLDYAAPEQVGKLPGVPVGVYSDIYGFGRTCCYALFQTTEPLFSDWKSLPASLAQLLERCLQRQPQRRPATFSEVRQALAEIASEPKPAEEVTADADPLRAGLTSGRDFERYATVEKIGKANARQYASALVELVMNALKEMSLARSSAFRLLSKWDLMTDELAELAYNDTDSSIRRFGVEQIRERNLRQYAQSLAERWRIDGDDRVRTEAFKTILLWDPNPTLPTLGLHDASAGIRTAAAEAAGQRDMRQLSDELSRMCRTEDEDAELRDAAFGVLWKWGAATEEMLRWKFARADRWDQDRLIESIAGRNLKGFAGFLIEVARTAEEIDVRKSAFDVLMKWNLTTEDLIRWRLRIGESKYNKSKLLEAIVASNLRQYADVLTEMAQAHEDSGVRRAAFDVLWKWGVLPAEDLLRRRLIEGGDMDRDQEIISSIGKRDLRQYSHVLADVASKTDFEYRVQSIEVLCEWGLASDENVRWAFSEEAAREDESWFEDARLRLVNQIATHQPVQFKQALAERVLNDSSDEVRTAAFAVLAELGCLDDEVIEWALKWGLAEIDSEGGLKTVGAAIRAIAKQNLRHFLDRLIAIANQRLDEERVDEQDPARAIIATLAGWARVAIPASPTPSSIDQALPQDPAK